jgi:imidazolonepropionase-like amidohydrolase
MRRLLVVATMLSFIVPSAVAATSLAPTFAITGATLIDGTGASPVADAVVLLRNGEIACAGTKEQCPAAAVDSTLDATGRWIIPGLFDTHMHWQIWYQPAEAAGAQGDAPVRRTELTAEAAARAAYIYLANGVTTVVDTGGSPWITERHRQVLDELAGSGRPAPRMLFSGWVNRKAVDAQEVGDAATLTRGLLKQGADGIKIRNGLTVEEYQAIVAEADRLGRPVYGHTYYQQDMTFVNYTSGAAQAGVDGVMHVLGIPPVPAGRMPSFEDLPPEDWEAWWLAGAELWLYADRASKQELIDVMVAHETWLQPTLVTEQGQIDPDYFRDHPAWAWSPMSVEEIRYGSPQFEGDDLATYQRAYRQMQDFVRRFHTAGGMLVAGTDGLPIPGFGMQEELRLLVEAGVPPMAALQAATRNAALAWRCADEYGTVEAGKAADLVILGGDPLVDITQTANIWRVVRAGVVLSPAELLEAAAPMD